MIDYGKLNEKGADGPDPAYMHHCKEFELRNDSSARDGLNGSIRLDKNDLKAINAEPGDPVRVYAEANGRWILYERDTYTDRAGVGIPKNHRGKLGLDSKNRIIELWLDEAESEPDNPSEEDENAGKQVSLTGEEAKGRDYVLILDDNLPKYHHISSSENTETECGITFRDREYRRFSSDPGDALDQCSDCAIRSSNDMTNKELVEWLGEQAGFEADDGTPAYLSKGQLVALRDYVLELQDEQTDESADENTNIV